MGHVVMSRSFELFVKLIIFVSNSSFNQYQTYAENDNRYTNKSKTQPSNNIT